jgi:cytochrome c-type biogenesis protein CcsB
MNDSLEIFKNLIFLNLFASMVCFWSQFFFLSEDEMKLQTEPNPVSSSQPQNILAQFSFGEIFLAGSFLLLSIELILRWIVGNHIPLSNLYESLLFLNWAFLGFFFQIRFFENTEKKSENGFERKNFLFFIGGILSSVVLFLQSFADWQLPDDMRILRPLIPALQSNWLLMHVSIMIFSYAALFFGCLLGIVYFIFDMISSTDSSQNSINQPTPENVSRQEVNLLNQLDVLSSQILSLGFPFLTLGILSGAIWANEAWGSYWSWDPKETWAFITWLFFAIYIHTRLQKGWRGRKSSILATCGFFIVWFCYLGVNLLGKGLHSYGWF